MKQADIAAKMEISRTTVWRLVTEYRQIFRKQLEETPKLHLIAERIAQFETIAEESLMDAARASSHTARRHHREVARKCLVSANELALSTGILPSEPAKVYSVTISEKREDLTAKNGEPTRTREEVIDNIERLLTHGRTLS